MDILIYIAPSLWMFRVLLPLLDEISGFCGHWLIDPGSTVSGSIAPIPMTFPISISPGPFSVFCYSYSVNLPDSVVLSLWISRFYCTKIIDIPGSIVRI